MSRENVSNRFISSAHERDGIDNTLARMLGADGKINMQFCGECGEQCSSAYQDPKDKSTFYCREHFEKATGVSVCEGCNRAIIGESPQGMGSKKYHQACYNVDHSCQRCSSPIVGSSTVFSGRQYHPKCFTCTYCNKLLSNTTCVDRIGRPYCSQCNSDLSDPEKAKFMNHSGTATETVINKAAEERNRIKEGVSQNVQAGKEQCATCRKTIVDQALQFADKVYHQDCFVCNKCKIPIATQSFVNKGGVAYCQPCGKSPSTTTCYGCNQPITSSYTVAQDNKYHPQCLVCSNCKKDLKGGYTQVQGQLMCGGCASKAPTVTSTTYTTGGRKGMVVDPRSGKRTYL